MSLKGFEFAVNTQVFKEIVLNSNCSNLLDMRNLQEQVKKAFCYQKLFWPFTVPTNCNSDLKISGRFIKHIPIKGAYYAFHIGLPPTNNFYIPVPLLRCYKLTLTPSAGEHVLAESTVRGAVRRDAPLRRTGFQSTIWWHETLLCRRGER